MQDVLEVCGAIQDGIGKKVDKAFVAVFPADHEESDSPKGLLGGGDWLMSGPAPPAPPMTRPTPVMAATGKPVRSARAPAMGPIAARQSEGWIERDGR